MGRSLSTAGAVAAATGRFNEFELFAKGGTFDWMVPVNLDPKSSIFVRVWGAGGNQGASGGAGLPNAGGGGGFSSKLIPAADLTLGGLISLAIGENSGVHDGVGGSTSFGAFLSATGANDGFNDADNLGVAEYGAGGIGVGGDVNRRGGRGGLGFNTLSSSGYGGGGGSAPAPDGRSDGYAGGDAVNVMPGAGASIHFAGKTPLVSIGNGGAGGSGTAGPGNVQGSANGTYYGRGGQGGNGIFGPGGVAGVTASYSNAVGSIQSGGNGEGGMVLDPNSFILGGGGGGGGASSVHSSSSPTAPAGNGGPGAGGGAGTNISTTGAPGGNGGMLGGGGGTGPNLAPGHGGNGGGAGATGNARGAQQGYGLGGDGLILIQFKLIH
jgi:hypothetical protein